MIRRILRLSAYAHTSPWPCSWVLLEGMSGAQGYSPTDQSQTRWARGPVGQAGHSSPLSAPPPKSQTHFLVKDRLPLACRP